MEHIVLTCGFELDVDPAWLDDFELFDAIAAVERGDILHGLPVIVDKIVGSRKKAFYDCFRDESGRVPMLKASEAIGELLQKLPAAKN